jgi:hypothetical protein
MNGNLSTLRRMFQPARTRTIRNKRHFRPRVEALETRLAPANVPILSGHYDNLLSGWNNQETVLNPTNVNDAGFGKLFNYTVDGYTYAQPLYVPNLNVGGTTYNVVFAATEHDSLYAFNADAKTGGPNNDGLLWQRSFINPANGITTMPSGETFSGDIVPEIGITGTPIIDQATNTLYVIAKTKEVRSADPANAHYVQKLYAIDITTGNNRASNGVVTIGDSAYVNGTNNFVSNNTAISVPGTGAGSQNGVLSFDARKENDRMSLQLVPNADASKTVYLAYASHGDNGPYHGWIVGYNASDLALKKVFNTSPNGSASGIWESGGNLGFDSQGNLYFSTGNGFGTGFNFNSGGPTALGAGGGALGYGNSVPPAPPVLGIGNSVSVRLRNSPTSTGLGTNGSFGTDVTMPGFDLNASAQAGNTFTVTLSYDATTKVLTETVVNNDVSSQTFSTTYNIDIPATVGGSTAYVGFTGSTSGSNAEQTINTWMFTPATGTGVNHGAGFASTGDLTANGGASLPQYTAPNPVGTFQYHQDLGIPGDPVPAGTAAFNDALNGGTYTLTASGTDIGFKANQYDTDTDRMQFVYNAMSGTSGEIIARVSSLTGSTNPADPTYWTKAVVQIRQSLDPQAANVQSVLSPHNVSEITWRDAPPSIDNAGNLAPGLTGATERGTGTGPIPGWIRLVRNGNTFTSYWAVDDNGAPGLWQGEQTHTTNMTGDVYVGIGLSSHSNGATATATFDHVTVAGFASRTQDPVAILTPAANTQSSSIFSNNKVDVSGNWSTSFTYQLKAGSNPVADGMTFTIQNAARGSELSESVLKLSTSGAGASLPVADYFTPHDWKLLDNQDADLGSGGTLLLPDAVGSAAHPHLIIETGKTGRLYLLDRDNLGQFNTRYDHIVQIVTLAGPNTTPGVWGNPAFFQDGPNSGILYYWGSSAPGLAFRISNGVISPMPVSQTAATFGFPGSQPSISSSGTNGGSAVMWAIRSDNYGSTGPESLYAYNAENLGQLLWTSADVSGRDAIGGSSVKFTFPIVSNGHVYAGSNGSLAVYGLLPAHNVAPATPANFQVSQVPAEQGGDTKLQLSWTNPSPNDATYVSVERSTTGAGGPFTEIARIGADQTSFTDTGLTPLTRYWYRIRAFNQPGNSAYTAVQDNITRLPGSKLSVANVTSGEVDLSWTVVGTDATFNIERSTDNFATFTTVVSNLPHNQTTYVDTTVERPNTYSYRVHAFNTSPPDESFSNVVSAVVAPVDIEFPFPDGIQNANGLQFNGSALFSADEHIIRLNNDFSQAGSVFTTNKVSDSHWNTTFWVRLHEGTQPNIADGFTFTLQANSSTALGIGGGGLGYQGIKNSVAIKFDVWNNEGETDNSTGVFFNGSFPGLPHGPNDVNVPLNASVVNLRDQHRKRIDISYDVSTLLLDVTITDEQHDGGPTSVHQTYTVNIPAIIGSDAVYVGFTGGTGGAYSLQDILAWVFPQTQPAGPSNLRASAGNSNDVTLNWTVNSTNEDGITVERSLDGYHFSPVTQLPPGATTYHDTDPSLDLAHVVYFYRVGAFNALGTGYSNTVVLQPAGVTINHSDLVGGFATNSDLQANGTARFPDPAAGTIGIFTTDQDIGTPGNPATPGSVSVANGVYTLRASGDDIFADSDAFHFVYKSLHGDGQITARVTSLDPDHNISDFTKAGVMIRETLAADSREVSMLDTRDHSFRFQRRATPGMGGTDRGPDSDYPDLNSPLPPPLWLRLRRQGNVFTAFWSRDGSTWIRLDGPQTINMATDVFIGLALTAHNNDGRLNTATFDNVTVDTAAVLTDGGAGEAGSVFERQRVPITGTFTTSFVTNIRPVTGSANGLAFVLQTDPRGAGALGGAGAALGYGAASELVTNGGFETGDTTGWTRSGDTSADSVITEANPNPTHIHSGTRSYRSGPENGLVFLTQNLATTPGVTYTLSFWLSNPIGGADTEWLVRIGGNTLMDVQNAPRFSYTNFTFSFTATSSSTVLQFGFKHPPDWFYLDDVSVTTAINPSVAIKFDLFSQGSHASTTGLYINGATGPTGQVDMTSAGIDFQQNHTYQVDLSYDGLTLRETVKDLVTDKTFTSSYAVNLRSVLGADTAFVGFTAGTSAETAWLAIESWTASFNPVAPPPHLEGTNVTPHAPQAGELFTFTVSQKTPFGQSLGYRGTVHFASSDPHAILPHPYTFTAGDAGGHTFTAALLTVGPQTITVMDDAGLTDTFSLVVTPTSILVTDFPSSTTAGDAHSFRVTALDFFGNVVTGYLGTVHFTSTDPQAVLPPDYTFTADDAGVHTFTATLIKAGTQSITVADKLRPADATGTQSGIQVNPGPVNTFMLSPFPSTTQSGVAHDLTVTAKDAYGNTVTNYNGTVHLSSNDGQADFSPNDYTFDPNADAGVHTFTVTLKTAGSARSIKVDSGGVQVTQGPIAVTPAAAVSFRLMVLQNPVTAGNAVMVFVTAVDVYGNEGAVYTGTVRFSSSDNDASLPSNYPFTLDDHGSHLFFVTFRTTGTQTLRVEDSLDSNLFGEETDIVVN